MRWPSHLDSPAACCCGALRSGAMASRSVRKSITSGSDGSGSPPASSVSSRTDKPASSLRSLIVSARRPSASSAASRSLLAFANHLLAFSTSVSFGSRSTCREPPLNQSSRITDGASGAMFPSWPMISDAVSSSTCARPASASVRSSSAVRFSR